MKDSAFFKIDGHCKIEDDLGNVHLDKHNAIHPQNMARIIARALSNEPNSSIYRIAFGNGGTITDVSCTTTFKTPNDGQSPDVSTWDSRLYHETFSKIIDEGQVSLNPLLGVDPGSADIFVGTRSGGGSEPSSDPPSVIHTSGPGVRSRELGVISQVLISCVLNADEPKAQFIVDNPAICSANGYGTIFNGEEPYGTSSEYTEGDFVFDELGLYTSGSQAINTSGYQYVDVGNRMSTDDTGLLPNTQYKFNIAVDGGTNIEITITTPSSGSGNSGEILYGDLCEAINTGNVAWGLSGTSPLPANSKILITDRTNGFFPTINNVQTYGYLKFESGTTGSSSSISVTNGSTNGLFSPGIGLNPPIGGTIQLAVDGSTAGVANNPASAENERERLLTHLIFSPVHKTANRAYQVTYTITISVARTVN